MKRLNARFVAIPAWAWLLGWFLIIPIYIVAFVAYALVLFAIRCLMLLAAWHTRKHQLPDA